MGLDVVRTDFLDQLECYGNAGQTQVCAVNLSGFTEADKWVVFTDVKMINTDEKSMQDSFETLPIDI